MDPLTIMLLATGLLSFGGGIWSTLHTNKKNEEAVKKMNKENRELTELTWARDDNAVTRRVEDLRNAGLSPTLAAGSPAGVSQPIRPSAFENHQAPDMNAMTPLLLGAQIRNSGAEYDHTRASINHLRMQDKLLQAQTTHQKVSTMIEQRMAANTIANDALSRRTDTYNLEKAQRWGIRTHGYASGMAGDINMVLDYVDTNMPDVMEQVTSSINAINEMAKNSNEARRAIGEFLSSIGVPSWLLVFFNN